MYFAINKYHSIVITGLSTDNDEQLCPEDNLESTSTSGVSQTQYQEIGTQYEYEECFSWNLRNFGVQAGDGLVRYVLCFRFSR